MYIYSVINIKVCILKCVFLVFVLPNIIDHFRVTLCLCFKTNPCKNFHVKMSLIYVKMNLKSGHFFITAFALLGNSQPRSQGLSSSHPLELQGVGRRETLGTRLGNGQNYCGWLPTTRYLHVLSVSWSRFHRHRCCRANV